jgi:nitronate monooxygenase
MDTRMTQMFGIEYPIMCGGIMWLAKPGLCAAISNAGGMGNLTAGIYDSAADFRNAIDETRRLTASPFCVNITLMPSVRIGREMHRSYLEVCCEQKIAAIEVSGAPLDRYMGKEALEMAKQAGIRLMHKVGSVKHAHHAEEAGYDAVIAAGFEEGGHPHSDDVTTMSLLPKVEEAVNIPVIAAGGIADGRTMAAAMLLGADGVMMASRFIATSECTAHPAIKEELVRRSENDTTLICRTLDMQMRALKNSLVSKVLEAEARGATAEEVIGLISGERSRTAWETGNAEDAPLAVGQSIGLIKDVPGCKELLDRMVCEAGAAIGQLSGQLARNS